VEADEDIYTSALREMKEETGLDVTDVQLRGIINVDAGQETGIIVFVFTARASRQEFTPSPEGALEWVGQDRIKTLDLVERLAKAAAQGVGNAYWRSAVLCALSL